MNISILCTDEKHPVLPTLRGWRETMMARGHTVELLNDKLQARQGDVLFLVSCAQLISADIRSKYRKVLVLHASELPKGRGWSPYVWSVLEGASELELCLLDACDPVDTGDIWYRLKISLTGYELLDEINEKIFIAEAELMSKAIENFETVIPEVQTQDGASYRARRTPDDSRLSLDKTIRAQFNLLRVVDNDRFPAFFEIDGNKYILKIEKKNEK